MINWLEYWAGATFFVTKSITIVFFWVILYRIILFGLNFLNKSGEKSK